MEPLAAHAYLRARNLNRLHTATVFDQHVNLFIGCLLIPGIVSGFLVLAAFAVVAWIPFTRRFLNRVSFRLLVYALTANLLLSISFIGGVAPKGPSAVCTFAAFGINFSLLLSTSLFFCMALNLLLVLVFKVNGQRMEKYYLAGTLILGLVCNVTPYAAGAYGWDAINNTCWFTWSPTDNPNSIVVWLVSTSSAWVLAMAAGEAIAFCVVLGYIWSYERATRAFRAGDNATMEMTWDGSRSAIAANSPWMKYRGMILRIGLYPLLSCLMNFSAAALDLYGAKNTVLTELNWRLSVLDLAIYAVRPLFYSLLAMTDPSFLRAVSALRRARYRIGGGAPPEGDTNSCDNGPEPEPGMTTMHWAVMSVRLRVDFEDEDEEDMHDNGVDESATRVGSAEGLVQEGNAEVGAGKRESVKRERGSRDGDQRPVADRRLTMGHGMATSVSGRVSGDVERGGACGEGHLGDFTKQL
uniref:G-protein coupled receptors family 2 profile 2 domain-containing protein n=1 Tax=Mycena chlorophos TaxID=658473 RepID=A0ABQ0LN44_MYCCL|nr:predicted protein [Mycena chlorophos]